MKIARGYFFAQSNGAVVALVWAQGAVDDLLPIESRLLYT